MTKLIAARERAIAFEEKKLRQNLKSLSETRQEVVAIEKEIEEIEDRLAGLRAESEDNYSSLIFHAELRQHGCLACASIRAGGDNVRTHSGSGPECPTTSRIAAGRKWT